MGLKLLSLSLQRLTGVKHTLTRLAIVAAASLFVAPAFSATPVQQAQAQLGSGDLQGALKTLDKYLAGAPQDAEARFTRGLVLVKLNKTEDAIKTFADLTRDYPQLPEPYNNLAVLYAQQGDYEKARDALEAALATHPAYATAHENLGDIYAALAGAAYNRAVTLDANNQSVRYKQNLINQLDTGMGAAGAALAPPAPSAERPAVTPAPAADPASVPGVANADAAAVGTTLTSWAKAWSAKDVDGYLAHYAADFQPEGGLARAAWEQQRRDRITRANRIAVQALKPQYEKLGEDRVRVNFVQEYKSDTFSDQVSKTLEFKSSKDGWKIVREYIR